MAIIRAVLCLAFLAATILAPVEAAACATSDPASAFGAAAAPCHGSIADAEHAANSPTDPAPANPRSDCECALACALRAAAEAPPRIEAPRPALSAVQTPAFETERFTFGDLSLEPPPPRA